jgi:hypothetical protein
MERAFCASAPRATDTMKCVVRGGLGLHIDCGAQNGAAKRPGHVCPESPTPPERRSQACVCRNSLATNGRIGPPGEKLVKTLTLAPIQGPQRTYRGSDAIVSLWNQHKSLALHLG